MPRIYVPAFTSILPPKQAQYVRVLRLGCGDTLELFDGTGQEARGCIRHIDKKTVGVDLGTVVQLAQPDTYPVHLAMGLIRNEPMDWAIQKAVELGVRTIMPLVTERSQGRFNPEQAERKYLHWQEIIISACEQSGLSFLPRLAALSTLPTFLTLPHPGLKLMFTPEALQPLQMLNRNAPEATLLIGPEGGFTPSETLDAVTAGFVKASLHAQTLRAETASVVATSLVQFHFDAR